MHFPLKKTWLFFIMILITRYCVLCLSYVRLAWTWLQENLQDVITWMNILYNCLFKLIFSPHCNHNDFYRSLEITHTNYLKCIQILIAPVVRNDSGFFYILMPVVYFLFYIDKEKAIFGSSSNQCPYFA